MFFFVCLFESNRRSAIPRSEVTDVEPDRRVKDAMNEKNAAKRLRAAAFDKAEAEKVMLVKQAEAEAEAKSRFRLHTTARPEGSGTL